MQNERLEEIWMMQFKKIRLFLRKKQKILLLSFLTFATVGSGRNGRIWKVRQESGSSPAWMICNNRNLRVSKLESVRTDSDSIKGGRGAVK